MVDLLQPEQIRKWGYHHDASERTPEEELLHRLCRDYLTLWERVEELRLPTVDVCDCCAGSGKPTSGGKCICGGIGTIYAELAGFRARVKELEDQMKLGNKPSVVGT